MGLEKTGNQSAWSTAVPLKEVTSLGMPQSVNIYLWQVGPGSSCVPKFFLWKLITVQS